MMRKFQDAGARFAEVGVSHYARPHGRSQFFRLPAIARFWSLSSSSSTQWASQPAMRGMANSTVNISTGKPIAW